MKKFLFVIILLAIFNVSKSQDSKKFSSKEFVKTFSDNACKCVDSIDVSDKSNDEVAILISNCIKRQTGAYQLSSKLLGVIDIEDDAKVEKGEKKKKKKKKKKENKQIIINIDIDEDSDEFKKYYYEIERYMMDNCTSMKNKVASQNKTSSKSYSDNEKALEYYSKGAEELENENLTKAVEYFEKTVALDPEFAFAWDNLGLCYRKLNNFDKALECYNKSLEIDPNGSMPLQNIPVVYIYKKEYAKAVEAYEKLAKLDENNSEVFYGIGMIYATYLNDYEKGLENACKAYTIYVAQKSPYRVDAEKLINSIYFEMKNQGKEEKFNEILKANNISTRE